MLCYIITSFSVSIKITVNVKLVFNNYPDPDVIPIVAVTTGLGSTVFKILQLAALQNPCYDFKNTSYTINQTGVCIPHGVQDLAYITTICGVENDDTSKYYWLFYVNNQTSPCGVDSTRPLNGDTVKFEYSHTSATHTTKESEKPDDQRWEL